MPFAEVPHAARLARLDCWRWTPSPLSCIVVLGWLPGSGNEHQQWKREAAETFCLCNYRAHPQQTTNQYLTFFPEIPKVQLSWAKLLQSSCILYDRCLVSTGRETRRAAGQTTAPPTAPITLGAQHIYIWPKYHYRRQHKSSATCLTKEYLLETFPTLLIRPSVLWRLQHPNARGTMSKPEKTFLTTCSPEQRDKLWKTDGQAYGYLPESRHYSPQKVVYLTGGQSMPSQLHS